MNDLPLPLASSLFHICKKVSNLQNFQQLANPKKNNVKVALETIFYRGPQLWNLVPSEIRKPLTYSIFRKKIKKWNCEECPCRLCCSCVASIWFMWRTNTCSYFCRWADGRGYTSMYTCLCIFVNFVYFHVTCLLYILLNSWYELFF